MEEYKGNLSTLLILLSSGDYYMNVLAQRLVESLRWRIRRSRNSRPSGSDVFPRRPLHMK